MNEYKTLEADHPKRSMGRMVLSFFLGVALIGLGIFLGLVPVTRFTMLLMDGQSVHGKIGLVVFSISLIPLGIWVLWTLFQRRKISVFIPTAGKSKMKKYTLTPFQNGLFTAISVLVFLFFIHTNILSAIGFVKERFHPLAQISIGVLFLGFAGIFAGISKVRQAGFSGPFTGKQPPHFKPLEVEPSFKGLLCLAGYLCQILIFSLSLYGVGAVLLWYVSGN